VVVLTTLFFIATPFKNLGNENSLPKHALLKKFPAGVPPKR
jgi:hypothetical protein